MSPTKTTTTAPVAAIDNVIRVASAAGLRDGSLMRLNDEEMHVEGSYAGGLNVPVLRGRAGTERVDHASGTVVTIAPYSDLYEGKVLTKAQHDDLCTRVEGVLREYVDAGNLKAAVGKWHDILARIPVDDDQAQP